jgi:hypothetical protein
MTSVHYDLTILAGADFSVTFKFYDSNNDPIDVSSSTFKSHVKEKYTDDTPIAEFDIDFAQTGEKNDVTLSLGHADTAELSKVKARYLWDLLWTDGSNNVRRPIMGVVTVSQEVTTT